MNFWRGRDGRPLFRMDYEGYRFSKEKDEVLCLMGERD
jgi:hypothetical protein